MNELSGHVTLNLGGDSYTFPLPRFAETVVRGWGPGRAGEFHQRAWSAEEIGRWRAAMDRHLRASRRWRWVRRIPLRVPVYRHGGWDDEGNSLRVWQTARLGSILAGLLIPDRPGPAGSHLLAGNRATNFVAIQTEGLTAFNNLTDGPDVRIGVGAAPTPTPPGN